MVTKELMIVLATLMLAFFVMACIGVIIKNESCVMFGAGFTVAFFALFLYFAVARPRAAIHKDVYKSVEIGEVLVPARKSTIL